MRFSGIYRSVINWYVRKYRRASPTSISGFCSRFRNPAAKTAIWHFRTLPENASGGMALGGT